MFKRTVKIFTVACVLALLTFYIRFHHSNRESNYVASFRLNALPQPKVENKSKHQPRKEESVAFLPENEILQGTKNEGVIKKSKREHSKIHLQYSFHPNILQQPPFENQSLHQPRKVKSLAFLPENEILQGSETFDAMNISIGNYSKVHLERSNYSLGEEIEVQIILYNGRGERKRRGGDYLRLWMEDVKAAVSGKVMDNNDGTYSGRVRAMWSGEADIRVMILGRREEIALMYQIYNKNHSLWINYAGFRNGSLGETSKCSVAPYDFTQNWCNLTAENAGFPWFCIEPKKPGLSCSKWYDTWSKKLYRNVSFLNKWPTFYGLDYLEKRKRNRIHGKRDRVASSLTPCNKVTPKVTWNRKSPEGFFYEDQWHSTQCTDTLNHTPTAYKECLRGRTLYLHGDSTSKQFIKYLNNKMNLTSTGGTHDPIVKSDLKYNFTLSWYVHELPFYHGRNHYMKSVNLAQHILLDRIKSNSRDIVILYLYVHFTINHPDVFKQHVHRLAQSARDLISRAPGVTIVVRGPHAFKKKTRLLMHSNWGLNYMDILHEEFASIQKKVLYLDYWDMTMARLPNGVHPPTGTVAVMVRYMMSLVCNRNNH